MSVFKIPSFLFLVIVTMLVSCSKDNNNDTGLAPEDNNPPSQSQQETVAIYPAATSYFSDPFPVRPWITGNTKFFYGTKGNILSCKGPLKENGFSLSGKTIIANGMLQPYIKDSGIKVKGYWAKNVFRDQNKHWHMVASARIAKGNTKWTTLVHLTPSPGEKWSETAPITHWTIDKMLVGSPLEPALANYAGK